MNIKSLLLFPVCALLAASSASAADALFTENWSEMAVGDIITDSARWGYFSTGAGVGAEDRLVIQEVGPEGNKRKVLASVFQGSDNFLPYAIIKQQFAVSDTMGISLDVTFERQSTVNYVRLAFMPANMAVPSGSNLYVVDFGSTAFKIARGQDNLSANISYTSVDAVRPYGDFTTYSFQIFEHEDGILLKVLNDGKEIWSGIDPTATSVDFSSGVQAMIGLRSGLNYVADVEVNAVPVIPETSHFAIGAGVLSLLVAAAARRYHRK